MDETDKAIAALLAPGGGWSDLAWQVDLAALEARGAAEAPAETAPSWSWSWKAVRMLVDCPACMVPVLVREVADEVRCDACGEVSALAARDVWRHGATPVEPDEDDDEEEDEGDEDGDDAAPDRLALSTNLADRIQRAVSATPRQATCAGCGAAIAADAVLAAAADGAHRCGCGRATPIVAASAWLREIDHALRYVVGGPLALGRPDGMLYLLRAQEAK